MPKGKPKSRHQQYIDAGKHEFMLVVDATDWAHFVTITRSRGNTATWTLRKWIHAFVKTGSPAAEEK